MARVKNVKDKDIFLRELRDIRFEPIQFEINNFKLKKSTLTKQGPVYEDLEIYDLV